MRCQHCRSDAPTRQVAFSQNIGLIVFRFPSRVEGMFCKRCIRRFFWKMTLISSVAGWWGVISFFTNLHFIFSNIATYLNCLDLPAAGKAPGQPRASRKHPAPPSFAMERMARFREEMACLLASGEPLSAICARFARRANVPEEDIREYLILENLRPAEAT